MWLNDEWRNMRLPAKTKRLYADATEALRVLEKTPEKFDLPSIIYYLHGNQTKQWAYATSRPDVIRYLLDVLDDFVDLLETKRSIKLHLSYPKNAVRSQVGIAGNDANLSTFAEREWVMDQWGKLISRPLPTLVDFHPRKNLKQKELSEQEPPGTMEMRLEKSLGILMAFHYRGKLLLSERIEAS